MPTKLPIPIVTFDQLHMGQRFIAAPGPGRVYTADAPAFIFLKLPIPNGTAYNSVNITTGSMANWQAFESVIPVAP